ncbi:MAG: 2-C-methyl-D-erythritol 4-phosphate cytidylyltransferase [Elusimicrobia bacterium]|nr:2-C-methyl-D-erythritol 4-phosphate cytidylyltransferase [Elusimicrobiota bacterium]
MKAAAVIVAAGQGKRMGKPKQFLPIAGRPMVHWSVEAFLKLPQIQEVVVVLSPEHLKEHRKDWKDKRVRLVEGGRTRLDSVRRGVAVLSAEPEVVAVHDGARPLVTSRVVEKCMKAAKDFGAAVPAVPVSDTLKEVSKTLLVRNTPNRSRFWSAQTPQCYRGQVLFSALKKFSKIVDASDESQIVEKYGVKVRVVPSTHENIKVTTPEDLVIAQAFLEYRDPKLSQLSKVGFGYDIHRLVEGRPLLLGGMAVPHSKGLLGHSDGDVVLHAVGDALLGALGEGEIGQYFPSSDERFRGISSRKIMDKVLGIVQDRKTRVLHLDISVLAEEPKLSPLYPEIKKSVAHILGISAEQVNVKAKTQEGLGEIGHGNAIACYAIATLQYSHPEKRGI